MYRVEMQVPDGAKATSPNPLLVALVELPDGTVSNFWNAEFGLLLSMTPSPEWIFGPEPVGPGSENGTVLNSTFVIPPLMPAFPPLASEYYVRVEPAPVMGPYAMDIDAISVNVDDQPVYRFTCPPDTLCPPPHEMVKIDPVLMGEGEHTISIEVLGSEPSFVMVGIVRVPPWDDPMVRRP